MSLRNSVQERDSSVALPPRRSRILLPLLLIVAAIFLMTLPWQRRQWMATARLQTENTLRESRIRDLKSKQTGTVTIENSPEEFASAADAQGSLQNAVRPLLSRGDLNAAGKRLAREEENLLANPSLATDPALASTLAGLFQEAGWVDRALFHAQRAKELAPNDLAALLRLAVIEAQLGWQKECLAHVQQSLKMAPQEAEPHLVRALLHDQVGALASAEKELLAADRTRPNDLNIALLLFRNRMSQHHYDQALATAETALQHFPTEPALTAARAEALIARGLAQVGGVNRTDLQAGLAAARWYQQLAPANKDAHFLIGKALKGLGDEAGALKEWETAHAALPNQLELSKSLGLLLFRQKQTERGKVLVSQSKIVEEEVLEYNRLLTLAGQQRHNPNGHRELARWCQKEGKLSRAILEWEQTLEILPNDAEAKRERADCVLKRASRD